ncbi:MAG: phosphoribosylaminoimidazolesuccinocarboxamide synthase [SAR202 cluster bacterium]|nr:phosphoribosylaminoimidazolesuccinocarboxamide synthase [SAR202 cluster bacterium]
MNSITETNLGNIWHRGKVRDTYEINNNQLLMISTDRISSFDVVLNDPIPGKGIILTEMSKFWFSKLSDVVNNHFDRNPTTNDLKGISEDELSRGIIANKATRIDIECVVRGYLAGSGLKEYQSNQTVCGIKLPSGLVESSKLNEPIFTPSTKAEVGHDENITFEQMCDLVGADLSEKLKEISLNLYNMASEYALTKNIIIADTKFEFGFINNEITLIDEILTPDSSRFWDVNDYTPGKSQDSYDKQIVRDWLETTDWNKEPPSPNLPKKIIDKTYIRYKEALETLTN